MASEEADLTLFRCPKWTVGVLTAIFFKLMQCQPQLNHQTQLLLVKGVWLVPNSQPLAGFCIGALGSVTVGVF